MRTGPFRAELLFFFLLTVMINPPDLMQRFCELLSITLTSRKGRITALMTRGLILNIHPTPPHPCTHAHIHTRSLERWPGARRAQAWENPAEQS